MTDAILRFEDVHKAFDSRAPVLGGFTAAIPQRGITFVVGQSGSGKSVLCRLAVGLLKPDRGRISLWGEDLAGLPERALSGLRRRAPYLVQGPALLDWLSVEENVALASGHDRAAARRALERVGELPHASAFPAALGPGTRKRISLARAIALEPEYLLLDEPTTGLDRASADEVIAAIARLASEGVGALIVSHDFRCVQALAERVLWVSGGRVGFFGPLTEFLASTQGEIQALVAPGRREATFDG